jgi:acyl-CoA thioester hydrolase
MKSAETGQNNEKHHLFSDVLTVRQRDIDSFGHVNHSVYLTYAEESRWRWYYESRFRETFDGGIVIAEAKVDFLRPITYPNEVKIETYVHTLGNSSLHFYHELSLSNAPELVCTKIDLKAVFFDFNTKKPTRMPEGVRKKLGFSEP